MPPDQILLVLLVVSIALNVLLVHLCLKGGFPKKTQEMTEEKILAMMEEGAEDGSIKSSEKELIENILEFNDLTAEDAMIHRRDVVMISIEDSHESIVEKILSSGLSRFPVYQSNADDIVGILSTRQYLLNRQKEQPEPFSALVRPAYFVPQTVSAEQLLRDMQSQKNHIAIVVDEYGGVAGIVTLEDLLEEIVGNIYDEFDPQAQVEILPLEDNLWRVSGGTDLEELAKVIEMELPEEELDFDTVGGLVFDKLSMIPEDGSCPEVEGLGLRIKVVEMHERRILWTLVSKLPPTLESNIPLEKEN